MKNPFLSNAPIVPLVNESELFVLNKTAVKKFVKSQLELANTLSGLEKKLIITSCKQIKNNLKHMPSELVIDLD